MLDWVPGETGKHSPSELALITFENCSAHRVRALIEINEDRLSGHVPLDDYGAGSREDAPELSPALADSLARALKENDDVK